MRKYILPSFLILLFGISLASAQYLVKSIQLSQDPTGPIALDASNNVYFPNKLLVTRAITPTLSTCGTSPAIVGNDTAGKVTTGSAATTCTITFSAAYNVAPACILSAQGASPVIPTYTTSTTAITVTVDVASTVYNYICLSQG